MARRILQCEFGHAAMVAAKIELPLLIADQTNNTGEDAWIPNSMSETTS
jgi:hypothetical protein